MTKEMKLLCRFDADTTQLQLRSFLIEAKHVSTIYLHVNKTEYVIGSWEVFVRIVLFGTQRNGTIIINVLLLQMHENKLIVTQLTKYALKMFLLSCESIIYECFLTVKNIQFNSFFCVCSWSKNDLEKHYL